MWLSLVERYVRDVEVASSNLVTSTIKIKGCESIPLFLWSRYSSRGWLLHSNNCKFAFTVRRSTSSLVRRRTSESSHLQNKCEYLVTRISPNLYTSRKRELIGLYRNVLSFSVSEDLACYPLRITR